MIITLIGYYGVKNIGDDLMLSNLIQYFSKKIEVKKIFIFVRNNYFDITDEKIEVLPLSKYSRLKKTKAIFRSDMIIWGGGTCIFEGTENRGLYDLLRIQQITKIFRKKFIFLGIGIGSLKSDRIIKLSKKIIENSEFIYFRDKQSCDAAKKISSVKNCCVGGDLVFLTKLFEPTRKKSNKITKISFSGVFDQSEESAHFYAKELEKLSKQFCAEIHFLPAHLSEKNDNIFHKKIIKKVPDLNYIIHTWNKPLDFVEILKTMDFHIGMRLHSIILADLLNIPNIGIIYSPKVEYYIRKSNILPEKRLYNLREHLNIQNIVNIFQQYEIPVDFIENEKKTALACLGKFWNLYAE